MGRKKVSLTLRLVRSTQTPTVYKTTIMNLSGVYAKMNGFSKTLVQLAGEIDACNKTLKTSAPHSYTEDQVKEIISMIASDHNITTALEDLYEEYIPRPVMGQKTGLLQDSDSLCVVVPRSDTNVVERQACEGVTAKGTACKFICTTGSRFCKKHAPRTASGDDTVKQNEQSICQGTTAKGAPCKYKCAHGVLFCKKHVKSTKATLDAKQQLMSSTPLQPPVSEQPVSEDLGSKETKTIVSCMDKDGEIYEWETDKDWDSDDETSAGSTERFTKETAEEQTSTGSTEINNEGNSGISTDNNTAIDEEDFPFELSMEDADLPKRKKAKRKFNRDVLTNTSHVEVEALVESTQIQEEEPIEEHEALHIEESPMDTEETPFEDNEPSEEDIEIEEEFADEDV